MRFREELRAVSSSGEDRVTPESGPAATRSRLPHAAPLVSREEGLQPSSIARAKAEITRTYVLVVGRGAEKKARASSTLRSNRAGGRDCRNRFP